MLINERTCIYCHNTVLIPYKENHVDRYHRWMQTEELQKLTASEPLTLEEEYDMQKSWREDEDKCTFIILDRENYENTKDEVESMIGDVNLFLNENHSAELEIMIAEPSARGKGSGKEAVKAMMFYGLEHLGIQTFTVKIGFPNEKSVRLFTNMGFQEVSRSSVFQEVSLELALSADVKQWLQSENKHIEIRTDE